MLHVAVHLLVCKLSLGARPMLLHACQQDVRPPYDRGNALLTLRMLYP